MSFSDLKKQSRTSIDQLVKRLEEDSNKKDYKDDRFWRPELDKSKNGFAIIRFLPKVEGEDIPWTKLYSHAFQGPGGWYIENSLTSLNQKDPISEMNTMLWNSGTDSDKDLARNRKRKLNYISNIYIVSDPANPQNEGKVFLFKYGSKIFEKIQEAMQPEFKDEEALDPFNFWNGANFKLKIRQVGGFVNYDKSEFDSTTPLMNGDDTKLEKIWKSQYPLKTFIDPSNFKSYDELKQRLQDVLKGDVRGKAPAARTADQIEDEDFVKKSPSIKSKPQAEETIDEETDALDYFKRLAEE